MKTKKILTAIVVLAASGMLFFTSCVKEDQLPDPNSEGFVEDSIDLPDYGWPLTGIDSAK